jgi:hypothetical protein
LHLFLLVTLWLLVEVRVVEQQLQLLEAVGVALEVLAAPQRLALCYLLGVAAAELVGQSLG